MHKKWSFPLKIFSVCDQIHRKLRIGSHFLKKPLPENFIFCAVFALWAQYVTETYRRPLISDLCSGRKVQGWLPPKFVLVMSRYWWFWFFLFFEIEVQCSSYHSSTTAFQNRWPNLFLGTVVVCVETYPLGYMEIGNLWLGQQTFESMKMNEKLDIHYCNF